MKTRIKDISERVSAWKWGVTSVLAVLLLAACTPAQPRKVEDIVTERATARWAALLAADFESAYHYTSPSYRAAITATAYRGKFGHAVKWLDAKVVAVTCAEEVCEVRVNLKSEITLGAVRSKAPIETDVVEKWIREAGDWWNFQSF